LTRNRLASCILSRLLLGVLISALPLRPDFSAPWSIGFSASIAIAESGKGKGGDGRDDDDDKDDRDDDDDDKDDRDDDNSGRGGGGDDDNSGRGGGGDDDNSGRGGGDDDSDDDRNSAGSTGSGNGNNGKTNSADNEVTSEILGSGNNLHLRYSNGWQEWVRNGRYRLVDPNGHTVADRRAKQSDLDRMRAAAGL